MTLSIANNNLAGVLRQLSHTSGKSIVDANKPLPSTAEHSSDAKPRSQAEVGSERFVGTGLKLELDLASGQTVKLDIRQSQSGSLRHFSLNSDHPLSADDEALLNDLLLDLSKTVDAMFNGGMTDGDMFDFANHRSIKAIDLDIQTDSGSRVSNLEFNTRNHEYGRKEVDAEWQSYNRESGKKAQHNLALSRETQDADSSYGAMDYQWLIEQIEMGVGTLNHSAGDITSVDSEKQKKISDFFVSGVQALFGVVKKGQSTLSKLGVDPEQSKRFLGQTIKALSNDSAQKNPAHTSESLNSLPDFKAHFYSKSENVGGADSQDEYKLAMEMSQMSHLAYDEDSERTSHTQTRRLLVELERHGETTTYEYKWKRDERIDRVYQNGSLDKGYYWLLDETIAQTTDGSGVATKGTQYSERSRYSSNQNDQSNQEQTALQKYAPDRQTSYSEFINTVA